MRRFLSFLANSRTLSAAGKTSPASLQILQLCHFGKLPSRDDFVRGTCNPQLLRVLEHWLSQGMALLAEEPRWKPLHDEAAPMHFVCLGSRSRLAIAGHVRPSHDGSSRRHPFVVAVPLRADKAIDFMTGAPALLQPFWHKAARRVDDLLGMPDPAPALQRLEAAPLAIETGFRGSASRAAYDDWALRTRLVQVEQMLNFDGHRVSLRRTMLALGWLLRPVPASGVSHLEKGLTLPLPCDPVWQPLVATYWLDLIAPFFARADFELLLCLMPVEGRPRLVIGFDGLSPRTLASLMHPEVYARQNIDVDDPDWVEDGVRSTPAMSGLVSCLEQPQLPLTAVRATFRDVFVGR